MSLRACDRGLWETVLRIPFRVTDGMACFQRIMDTIIEEEGLTVCEMTQQEHDENLQKFLSVAKRRHKEYNTDKCTFSTTKLCTLGYEGEGGEIWPDPIRLKPLRILPFPEYVKSLSRTLGYFAYYSRWIYDYSRKIRPLTTATTFPLSEGARAGFQELTRDVENCVVKTIDETFEVETDASECAIAAFLTQDGRPVAFFSRTLQGLERNNAAFEKEAQAIVEAVRHWRHYLVGRHFSVKTDQRSISYMLDKNKNF